MFEFWKNLIARRRLSRRIVNGFGPPEWNSEGTRTGRMRRKISPDEYVLANNDAAIVDAPVTTVAVGQRRVRASAYALTLEEMLEDFAQRLLDDDDLEEAVYILIQFAKSRGYKFEGTSKQVLTKLYQYAENREWKS